VGQPELTKGWGGAVSGEVAGVSLDAKYPKAYRSIGINWHKKYQQVSVCVCLLLDVDDE
jgi:hypothetical protein